MGDGESGGAPARWPRWSGEAAGKIDHTSGPGGDPRGTDRSPASPETEGFWPARGKGALRGAQGGGGWAYGEHSGLGFGVFLEMTPKIAVRGLCTDGTARASGMKTAWGKVAPRRAGEGRRGGLGSGGRRHHRPLPVPNAPRPVRGP